MELKKNIKISSFVSNESNTLHFLKRLFYVDFYDRLQFIKSSYKMARVDFMILNKENLKSIVIEVKDWLKRPPSFISKNKIDNLIKHYDKSFLVLSHLNTYYWLDVRKTKWEEVEILKIPNNREDAYDYCYNIENLLSTDYENLEIQMRLYLIT